jgi:hypothetical protein
MNFYVQCSLSSYITIKNAKGRSVQNVLVLLQNTEETWLEIKPYTLPTQLHLSPGGVGPQSMLDKISSTQGTSSRIRVPNPILCSKKKGKST